MRNVLRCLRQLRPAFQRRHCVLFSVNVGEESPCHFGKSCHIHSSAYRVIDPGETNFVKNHSFVAITRALSTDVAKLRNTGSHLFFSRCAGFRRVWNLFSSYFFLYLNLFSKLQKQPKLGLLLSMNEELLMVNLQKVMLARQCLHFILMPNFFDEMDFPAYFIDKRFLDITIWIIYTVALIPQLLHLFFISFVLCFLFF